MVKSEVKIKKEISDPRRKTRTKHSSAPVKAEQLTRFFKNCNNKRKNILEYICSKLLKEEIKEEIKKTIKTTAWVHASEKVLTNFVNKNFYREIDEKDQLFLYYKNKDEEPAQKFGPFPKTIEKSIEKSISCDLFSDITEEICLTWINDFNIKLEIDSNFKLINEMLENKLSELVLNLKNERTEENSLPSIIDFNLNLINKMLNKLSELVLNLKNERTEENSLPSIIDFNLNLINKKINEMIKILENKLTCN